MSETNLPKHANVRSVGALGESTLRIPIRWYRLGRMYGPGMPQRLKEGLQERPLERSAGQMGLVLVHCWNLGESDGPYPFEPGVRSAGMVEDWVPRAQTIIADRIKPLLESARRAQVAVFHLCVDSYARRYPTYRAVATDPELRAPPASVPANVCVNPRTKEERLDDVVGPGWPGAVWNTHSREFDIARAVRPLENEPVITNGWQLNGLCRRAGIDSLFYAGFMADICIQNISGAMREMANTYRYRTIVLRDCTTAYEYPETHESNLMTFAAIRFIEAELGFSASSEDFIAAAETVC